MAIIDAYIMMVNVGNSWWLIITHVGKTKPCFYHPFSWEWFIYTTYKNGDDWGMVYDIVFTHINFFPSLN